MRILLIIALALAGCGGEYSKEELIKQRDAYELRYKSESFENDDLREALMKSRKLCDSLEIRTVKLELDISIAQSRGQNAIAKLDRNPEVVYVIIANGDSFPVLFEGSK